MLSATMRHRATKAISRAVEWSHHLLGTERGPRAAVLCYHSINPQSFPLSVSPEALRAQIAWLRQAGYEFLTFSRLAQRLAASAPPPGLTVALTFDDGFDDNYLVALPVLQKLDVPATFFVTSGLATAEAAACAPFRQRTGWGAGFLDARQLREMRRAGMEIAAHTHSHPNLARLDAEQARRELVHSKRVLEELLGEAVSAMAYPFGKRGIHHTRQTRALVLEAGYLAAASVAFRTIRFPSPPRPFDIPRIVIVATDTLETFQQKMSGRYDWLGIYHQHSPRWLKAMVSPEDDHC